MKTFDQYQDGDWVIFRRPGHQWHLMSFQAYKSQWTHDAFRLKFGDREVIADIQEIDPIQETNKVVQGEYENFNKYIRGGSDVGAGQDSYDLDGQDRYSDIQD